MIEANIAIKIKKVKGKEIDEKLSKDANMLKSANVMLGSVTKSIKTMLKRGLVDVDIAYVIQPSQ